MRSFYLLMGCWLVIMSGYGRADIFEHTVPSDGKLREAIEADRSAYYFHSSGEEYRDNEKAIVSGRDAESLRWNSPWRVRDNESLFHEYLNAELKGRVRYAPDDGNGLLLLTYASPAMADVLKHDRMFALERSAMDLAYMRELKKDVKNPVDRLASLSEEQCLRQKLHGSGMRLRQALAECRDAGQAFSWLPYQGKGGGSIFTGILKDLGFPAETVKEMLNVVGDIKVDGGKFFDMRPGTTFHGRLENKRQNIRREWEEAFREYQEKRRVNASVMQALSFPGVPVTTVIFESLLVLPAEIRDVAIRKVSSAAAAIMLERRYEEVLGYLDLAIASPDVPFPYQEQLIVKRDLFKGAWEKWRRDKEGVGSFKELLAEISYDADIERVRLAEEKREGEGAGIFLSEKDDWQGLLLDR
jgi:hypothetical protein